MARCPHCKNTIDQVRAEPVEVNRGWSVMAGTAYCCPLEDCGFVISVEADNMESKEQAIRGPSSPA